ncbi:alginate export family protein [Chenggangzhangella methanolivorans]|uniref:alginate export family protein n=1 Tax=Chenggangzhangella methanolivorans TaxID=1437009 RepID=UPI003615BF51
MSAALFGAAPVASHAEISTDIERAPTLTIERHGEDWSYLADPDRRTGHWTEPFKYIPLNADDSLYLTTGVETRMRLEGYEGSFWGSAPDDAYVWSRLMPYADLHAGPVRVFAQPILSSISGSDHQWTPVDTTGADMLQAFVGGEIAVADRASLRLSAGRKLVSLGAGRFIDTRYGPNVLQSFEGGDATLTGETAQVTALHLQPVDTLRGDFDDRRSRQKKVWGLYVTRWLTPDRATGFDVYYLGFRDREAVFDQGAGRQLIHTFGGRLFGDAGAYYWNFEGAVQRGSFAGGRVAAWGVGGEVGRRFRETLLEPELALTVDVVSGDDDPDDSRLGTLNPLFPRGKYFASQSPVGPRNLIHLQPSVTVHPHTQVAASLRGAAYWRQNVNDGVYAIPGTLVRSGRDSDARFIGKQAEFAVAWRASAELTLSASVGVFVPGSFVQDTGPARTIKMTSAMANFRF